MYRKDSSLKSTDIITPIKKISKDEDLLDWQKTFNTAINQVRAVVERVIAQLKNWRILHTDYRRPLVTFGTTTMLSGAVYDQSSLPFFES